MLRARPVPEPVTEPALDLRVRRARVLAPEPLAHEIDPGLVEIEGDPQSLAQEVVRHAESIAVTLRGGC